MEFRMLISRPRRNGQLTPPDLFRAATLFVTLASFVLSPAASVLAAPQGVLTYQQLKSFGGPPTGTTPYAELMQGVDGALYGTAQDGGSNGNGTVFKLNADGTGFTVLLNLDYSATGAFPSAGLIQDADGALYGTAAAGGSAHYGTLFKLNPDGTGVVVLVNFDHSTTGDTPVSRLMQGTDGALYGTARYGGSVHDRSGIGFGTLFKLNTDGSGFTVLVNFDRSTTGSEPVAGLMQATDGALYGAAASGGRNGGDPGYGTLFKLNPDGSGFTVLKNLYKTAGTNPVGGLIQGKDGLLYGTTSGGGVGPGTVFKMKSDGTGFNVLLNCDNSTGHDLEAGLMQGTDGALYGTGFWGGTYNCGTAFKLNPDGSGFTVLQNFDKSKSGSFPSSRLMQATGGTLFGTASAGGGYNSGTLYKLNADGTGFTVVKTLSSGTDLSDSGGAPDAGLVQGTDGAFYGAATRGGTSNSGTLFKLSPDGTEFTILANLDYYTTGNYPSGALVQGTDGALYGTAVIGGWGGAGTVLRLNLDGTDFSVLTSFDYYNTGGYLSSGLVEGSDTALYGTAGGGGAYNFGTLFKLNMDGTGLTILKNFDGSMTGAGGAALLAGTDGALYGTGAGGSGGYGTVYRINPDGTGFTVLQDFDYSTTGDGPNGMLMQGTDGALYGTASGGGSFGFGTLYKLNTDGTGFISLVNFDSSTTGAVPNAGLMQETDGALYGTASVGGKGGYGTAFKVNPDGTGFTVLQDFDGSTTGKTPLAGLKLGTDGNLYGTTSAGGDFDVGTVYRLITDCTASWTNYGAGFTGTNGVPNFVSSANPVLGTTITLTVDDSSGSDTAGFLIAGLNRASIPFKLGTVLVDPFRDWLLVLPLSISATGMSLDSAIPSDESLCGFHVDLQALEFDSGAAEGISFTPGLELVLGH